MSRSKERAIIYTKVDMFFMAKKMVKPLVRSVNRVNDDPSSDSLKTLLPIEVIRHLGLHDKERIIWTETEDRGEYRVRKYSGKSK